MRWVLGFVVVVDVDGWWILVRLVAYATLLSLF